MRGNDKTWYIQEQHNDLHNICNDWFKTFIPLDPPHFQGCSRPWKRAKPIRPVWQRARHRGTTRKTSLFTSNETGNSFGWSIGQILSTTHGEKTVKHWELSRRIGSTVDWFSWMSLIIKTKGLNQPSRQLMNLQKDASDPFFCCETPGLFTSLGVPFIHIVCRRRKSSWRRKTSTWTWEAPVFEAGAYRLGPAVIFDKYWKSAIYQGLVNVFFWGGGFWTSPSSICWRWYPN